MESQTPAPTLSYRPEIDGLRAIAVLSVILYHAEALLPGGYVGVDVFFVISGYLITASRWSNSLGTFLVHRIARIFPAFFACLLVMVGVFAPITCVIGDVFA